MEINHKNHDHAAVCPHCPPANSQPLLSKSAKDKLLSFLGVCGSLSCYAAMFPAIILGIVGVFGLSQSNTLLALNAYAASPLFNPILIVSILFLVAGVFPYGKLPIGLSILGGIGIYISMNFYMREWLFTLSFAFVALAYFFALRQTKAPQLKTALILISVVIILGVIDIGRTAFSSPNPRNNNVPQQQAPPSMMQMQ